MCSPARERRVVCGWCCGPVGSDRSAACVRPSACASSGSFACASVRSASGVCARASHATSRAPRSPISPARSNASGVMYRAIALAALRRGIDADDAERLAKLAREVKVAIGPPTVRDGRAYTVLLDGDDVTWTIRGADVDRSVSQVARVGAVRDAMVEQQRGLAERGRVVMVGRDIGTVVLPRAERKIYLTASPSERATRRDEARRAG